MKHIPVMLQESLEVFKDQKLSTFFDGTLGAGGFAKAMLEAHPEIQTYFGCDQDERALEIAKENLKDFEGKVSNDELETLKGKNMELKELLKPDKKDSEALKKKIEEINTLIQKISTEMYKKASEEQAKNKEQKTAETKNKSKKTDQDNVVDAEYEEKENKKK